MVEKISITICGDGGCGKSSITLRLVKSQWTHEYDPTIEDSYSVTRHVDGIPYLLSLTDTAGQEEYRGLWAASNLSSDAFLLVYDITSSHSLENLQYFLDMIDTETEVRENDNRRILREMRPKNGKPPKGLKTIPVKFLAANKVDLKDSRQVPAAVGLDWARSRGCGFMETSAREMVNIEETFALIVRRVVEARRFNSQSAGRSGVVSPSLTIPQTSPAALYGQSPQSANSQQPLVATGGPAYYQSQHRYNPSSGSGGAMPLQVNPRQAPSPPPPLARGGDGPSPVRRIDYGANMASRPQHEKSGFDSDDGDGRKKRFGQRLKRWFSCGCFRSVD